MHQDLIIFSKLMQASSNDLHNLAYVAPFALKKPVSRSLRVMLQLLLVVLNLLWLYRPIRM